MSLKGAPGFKQLKRVIQIWFQMCLSTAKTCAATLWRGPITCRGALKRPRATCLHVHHPRGVRRRVSRNDLVGAATRHRHDRHQPCHSPHHNPRRQSAVVELTTNRVPLAVERGGPRLLFINNGAHKCVENLSLMISPPLEARAVFPPPPVCC